ncbi:max dimerization protein 4 isoform X2 [Lissotriton helveticus]
MLPLIEGTWKSPAAAVADPVQNEAASPTAQRGAGTLPCVHITNWCFARRFPTASLVKGMELNSLLVLLEAAEYLERRDREAEHGYASVLPFDSDYSGKKNKTSVMGRRSPNNRRARGMIFPVASGEHEGPVDERDFRCSESSSDLPPLSLAVNSRSSHNELEKHRRAKLRLYLEQLKQLVPLGPDSTRHTTLSLLKRAKMHIKDPNESRTKQSNVHLKQIATGEVKVVTARPVWIPKAGLLVREKISDKKEFGPSYRKPAPVLVGHGTRTVLLPPLAGKREKRFAQST